MQNAAPGRPVHFVLRLRAGSTIDPLTKRPHLVPESWSKTLSIASAIDAHGAEVIYPPVAIETFYSKPAEDFFLIVGELVPYKRLDYAVRVFARTGRRLKIAGDGPEFSKLKKMAGPTVEFCGRVSNQELRDLYASCRALIVPGEEDFGMCMVEALASGKPVLALGRGGALEIVGPGSGVLYMEACEAALEAGVERVEARQFKEVQKSCGLAVLRMGIHAPHGGTDRGSGEFAGLLKRSSPGIFYNMFTSCLRLSRRTESASTHDVRYLSRKRA